MNPAAGIGIAGSVESAAAVDPIIAEAAFENVVAGDSADIVAGRIGVGRDRPRSPSDAMRIPGNLAVAIERVIPASARQNVVAKVAREHVVVRVAA